MADFDADDAEDEQSILFEMSRPHWLFSEPTLLRKRFYGCMVSKLTNFLVQACSDILSVVKDTL